MRKIVTVCGSLRFIKKIQETAFVVNVDGYLGEAAREEIVYAKDNGKEIFFLE